LRGYATAFIRDLSVLKNPFIEVTPNWMCSTTYEIIPMTCCVGMRGGWHPVRHRRVA
jgi:hypothetical protein